MLSLANTTSNSWAEINLLILPIADLLNHPFPTACTWILLNAISFPPSFVLPLSSAYLLDSCCPFFSPDLLASFLQGPPLGISNVRWLFDLGRFYDSSTTSVLYWVCMCYLTHWIKYLLDLCSDDRCRAPSPVVHLSSSKISPFLTTSFWPQTRAPSILIMACSASLLETNLTKPKLWPAILLFLFGIRVSLYLSKLYKKVVEESPLNTVGRIIHEQRWIRLRSSFFSPSPFHSYR